MNPPLSRVHNLYGNLLAPLPFLRDAFLLFIRLYWGWLFSRAGYGKLVNHENASEFFSTLGMPFPEVSAYMVGLTELLGGILMGLGLGTRVVSLILTLEMIGAFLVAHREELLSVFSSPEEFYGAPPFPFLLASVLVFLFGPGRASVDYLLSRFFKGLK